MKILGLFAVFCLMIIYAIDVCDAECDDYLIVLEELFCPINNTYRIIPLKKENINWDDVMHPCNSTDKISDENACVVEFNCENTELFCEHRIKPKTSQTHTFIADNYTEEPIISTTQVLDLPINNITVTEKPQNTVNEVYYDSTLDVNLIFINENDIVNSSETINKKRRNQTLFCEYAEIVCTDEGKYEDDIDNVTDSSHHNKSAEILEIEINRDETSTVQPIFTGYFDESSTDSSKMYADNFRNLKTMTMPCPILKNNNCNLNMTKSLKQINIFTKTVYIKNYTITKYPNCSKDFISPENILNVKCEDVSFAIHNKHILQTVPPPPIKQELLTWSCNFIEFNNTLTSKEQLSGNNKLYFINCSKDKEIKSRTNNAGSISDIKSNKTEILEEETEVNKILENKIKILLKANELNCSNNISPNIDEGKIIDLDKNNTEENILQNNHVELKLSNCINVNTYNNPDTHPELKGELTIILKNESLNTSNLKQFNGSSKDASVKQRILLRCDFPNLDSSGNTSSNVTELQCEWIDLDSYNITGIEDLDSHNITIIEDFDSYNITGIKMSKDKNNKIKTEVVVKVQKDISEDKSLNLNFNRKKDIPNGAGQNNLALGSPETEKILLITLLTITCVAILLVIALRSWPKKKSYSPAPTREPPDEEETAF